MSSILIKNAMLVNEGSVVLTDVHVLEGIIKKIAPQLKENATKIIDAKGLYLLPGVIDDQVHFREPGLTHKGEIYTEAKAAVAGGVTTYMEMPNVIPATLTQDLLEQKYSRASEVSLANYSFFMGASNDNRDEVLKTNPKTVCGVKIFMGSSTGNMLVDNKQTLETIFAECKTLIATHCEDEPTIKKKIAQFIAQYGDDIPVRFHPLIRSEEACYKSSSYAAELAAKYNTRLHILHISTAKEISLFKNNIPLKDKRITAEACIHHLWFSEKDYDVKGNFIKWNPAVKTEQDRQAVFNAVLENKIDIIATDHAPHTQEEKMQVYTKAPSGGPLIQHSLVAMLEFYHQQKISLERIVEKMCHAPADCFQVEKRGYVKEGYYADLVLVDLNSSWTVDKSNLLYKCNWSPFEGYTFKSKIKHTFVNGHHVYNDGVFDESKKGMRVLFDR
ncbi:MAG: dihydroorotase [Bacteroidetes bacterium]|nr:dihydroorotase [Bacteroidota bacterium]